MTRKREDAMRSGADLLLELNSVDESTRIDAKAASEIGRSILETVCAFADEPGLDGGYLLLGVEPVGSLFEPVYEPVGLKEPEKVQADLVTQCSTAFNRPIRPQVATERIDGKTIVVAYIPEASSTDKPIYLTRYGLPRGAYRRLGPTDHEGTEDDLIALYADHQGETYDTTVITDGTIDDINTEAIDEYRAHRLKINPAAEELTWSNEDLLRAFGCARLVDGLLRPTVASVLMFGTPMALRRCFPMMRIDYIRIPGRKWVENPDHRFDTIEIRAPLISALRRATNAILDDIPRSFSLPSGEIQSTEQPILPTRVIREAVVNAVMHRSYRIHGAIQIIRYANRLEIRNPGHSLKTEEQLGEPGSETRNPRIAAVLHEVNIAETKGSGVRVMRELMRQSNLIPPTLESTRRPDQFVATFLFHHFLGPGDVNWLAGLTQERLSDEESRALVFVREVGAIDNAAYREINRAETLAASAHLRRLRDIGLLEKKGSGSRTYYLPSPVFIANEVGEGTAQSHQLGPQSHQLDAQSHQLGPQSHQLVDEPAITESLPEELTSRLPQPGQRLPRERLHQLIQDLCSHKPLSSRELAAILGRRDQKPLVRDHLNEMIEKGELAYSIPKMPHHPDQTYTVPPGAPVAGDEGDR